MIWKISNLLGIFDAATKGRSNAEFRFAHPAHDCGRARLPSTPQISPKHPIWKKVEFQTTHLYIQPPLHLADSSGPIPLPSPPEFRILDTIWDKPIPPPPPASSTRTSPSAPSPAPPPPPPASPSSAPSSKAS